MPKLSSSLNKISITNKIIYPNKNINNIKIIKSNNDNNNNITIKNLL